MRLFKTAQKYLFSLIICLSACQDTNKPNLDSVDLELHIERFDQAIDSLTKENLLLKNNQWQHQYGQFYTDYLEHMLQVASPKDTAQLEELMPIILGNPDFDTLKTAVQNTFPDLSVHEKNLTDAFKHIKYFFPESPVPRIISFFSGFTVQTPINEDYIGIGLDMFLGSDSRFYPALVQNIPLYISRRFTPEYIVPRTIETYLRETLYPEKDQQKRLLEKMVYNGKIMYLMDQFLPDLADSIKIGYSTAQLAWAQTYEKDIWAWFLEEELLYNSDYAVIQKYLTDAPFTPELGNQRESAPKLGVFIGWNLIKAYMKQHPDLSLQELLYQEDAQLILNRAKYKGKH